MCCLKYEQNVYEDASRRMPKAESFVQTPDGPGNVKSVDLLREKRPCMFFTGDNLIGVRDSSRLYIYFPDSRQELCYRTDGFRMEKAAADSAFLNLRHYGFSMLQCAETLVQRGQTLDHQEEQKAQ